MVNLSLDDVQLVTGGYVIEDKKTNKYWLVRQNGTVISLAPSKEKALEFIKAFNESATIMSLEEYKEHFGRDLVW